LEYVGHVITAAVTEFCLLLCFQMSLDRLIWLP
jgi:hypothetical protein